MKAKVIKTGEIIEVEQLTRTTAICPANGRIYNRAQLDLNCDPPQSEAIISGWVARDSKIASNTLCFYRNEITREKFCWDNKEANRPIGESLILPKDLFPDLTWEDEPIEVEITIKRKKI